MLALFAVGLLIFQLATAHPILKELPAALAAGQAAGWPVLWSGGEPGTARYAYFEPPPGNAATIIELMELTPATIGMGELVRSAAVNWDGSDPIRSLFG